MAYGDLNVPAFGFSAAMTRPVDKSPLDTRQLYAGTDFAAQDEQARQGRVKSFQAYAGANPGAAPGGTGDTGLAPTDSHGFASLMERQQQYLRDLATGSGHAAPTVQVGAYDGSHLSDAGDAGGPLPAPRGRIMGSNASSAAPAMKGLTDALSGGGGRLPQTITDDPALYHAYEMMLLDQMQGAGREARMSALAPADAAMLNGDTRINDVRGTDRQFERDQDYADTVNKAAAGARAFNGYGKQVMSDQYDLAGHLAEEKGDAAAIDDRIRAGAQLGVAGINAGVQDRRTTSQAAMNGLTVAQRETANQRQFGPVDPAAQQQLTSRLNATPAGVGAPAAPLAAGPPEQEIQQAMRARGWSREQALAEWQRRQGAR